MAADFKKNVYSVPTYKVFVEITLYWYVNSSVYSENKKKNRVVYSISTTSYYVWVDNFLILMKCKFSWVWAHRPNMYFFGIFIIIIIKSYWLNYLFIYLCVAIIGHTLPH